MGYMYEEWVLGVGTPIHVRGKAVDRAGILTICSGKGSAKLLISTESEDELSARRKKRALFWMLGSAGLAVVAVALVIAGLAAT